MSDLVPKNKAEGGNSDAFPLRRVLQATKDWKSKLADVPVSDLVKAVDSAAALVRQTAAELQERKPNATVGDLAKSAVPSLLAYTAEHMVSAILSDERLQQRLQALEDEVHFTIDPRTRSGLRLKSMLGRVGEIVLDDARPDEDALDKTLQVLKREGFTILRMGRFGIRACGPARLLSAVLNEPLAVTAVPRPARNRATMMFTETPSPPTPSELFAAPRSSLSIDGKRLHAAINDFVFVPPPLLLAPVAYPSAIPAWAVDRGRMRQLLRVPNVSGRGQGVRLAIVDSGFDFSHPYFASANFNANAVSTRVGPQADIDPAGHGTAMAANALTIAPNVELLGFKFSDPGGAIEEAATAGAEIISCSWGYNMEQTFPQMHLSIRSAIEDDGCIVLFAAGNGQYCWPASDPNVIAIGGVYADPASMELRASDFASGFTSNLYPGRHVPDICGLCGMAPAGIYLPLPVPPGSELDRATGGLYFPDKDETGVDDGWVYASGTSSATAQIAGVTALLVEQAKLKGRTLNYSDVRTILQQSARPVTAGHNVFGFPAIGHPNIAVGYGLVDVTTALSLV